MKALKIKNKKNDQNKSVALFPVVIVQSNISFQYVTFYQIRVIT
jgi:hypothetical protein